MTDPLADEPPSQPTRRYRGPVPHLYEEALRLRRRGCTVPEIARRVGVARSTAYLWVRHLPLAGDSEEARARRRAHSKLMTDAQWAEHRAARDAARSETVRKAAAWVERLGDRELVLVGAAIYWCEGGKAKPWRPNDCRLKFINSDPVLVLLFLRFVEALGVARAALRFRVSIHESADEAEAVRWWADLVGVPAAELQRSSFKRHRPATRRQNVGAAYRGCLTVYVPRSSHLYWTVEGIMKGMGDGVAGSGR
ncbi:helix-turn-helix domain-containing protein [Micromonospora sp. CPCC 205561]|uniref:helix-turn-helix domain-containing protein n=1 Tax=Micromonospora sp. CPCC 205561 TaxID=3122407 RepID=UPI002FF0AF4C